MVTISGLFVSPAKGSGLSTPVERARAVAGHGFEGCAHAGRERRGMLAVVVEGGDDLSLL